LQKQLTACCEEEEKHWGTHAFLPGGWSAQTYDMPVETANALGALPHDGDFLHLVFLNHMRLNRVEVVREIV